jgi:UDP-N-acetylmuramate dehydrogenase
VVHDPRQQVAYSYGLWRAPAESLVVAAFTADAGIRRQRCQVQRCAGQAVCAKAGGKVQVMMAAASESGLRGELMYAEPMSAHTSWRVGGPADRCYRPADLEDLKLFLASLPEDEPLLWVGLGSNLLVRDGGIRGTVILPFGGLDTLELSDHGRLRAGAGVACAKVARFAARAGLTGAEFLAGIPGTMGGALAMNAGAFGGETWSLVAGVETLDHRGMLHQRSVGDYQIAYRSVIGAADEWFVSVELQLQSCDVEVAQSRIRSLLERRSATQPTQQPSCGSVFRNPPDDFAARLIESCGLKGEQIGDARVSEKHANFVVNLGQARAADIEGLIRYVQERVQQKHGVRLKAEVRIVGEFE